MNREYSLHFAILKHIITKQLQNYFIRWNLLSKYSKKPKPTNLETPSKKALTLVIKTESPCLQNSKKEKVKSKSPIETSRRLYTQAKEIQKKKDLLKQLNTPEYSFTPKVTGFTKKWLQIKQGQKNRKSIENIAIVSARTLKETNENSIFRTFTPIL